MPDYLGTLGIALVLPLFALPTGWLVGVAARKLRILAVRQSWRTQSVIIAEYDPPAGLKPAEVAFLYDRSFGEPELLATLFDLELRNMVGLQAVPSGTHEPNFNIILKCKGTEKSLADFEQNILLRAKSQARPSWSLLKDDSVVWDTDIEQALERDLSQRGYFWPTTVAKRLLGWFLLLGALTAFCLVVLPAALDQGWFSTNLSTDPLDEFSRQVGMGFVALLWLGAGSAYTTAFYYAYVAYTRAMDMERGTKRLRMLWPYLDGFRKYLEVVEQSRIKFENQTLKELARTRALPYAVALDLHTNWQARFRIK